MDKVKKAESSLQELLRLPTTPTFVEAVDGLYTFSVPASELTDIAIKAIHNSTTDTVTISIEYASTGNYVVIYDQELYTALLGTAEEFQAFADVLKKVPSAAAPAIEGKDEWDTVKAQLEAKFGHLDSGYMVEFDADGRPVTVIKDTDGNAMYEYHIQKHGDEYQAEIKTAGSNSSVGYTEILSGGLKDIVAGIRDIVVGTAPRVITTVAANLIRKKLGV